MVDLGQADLRAKQLVESGKRRVELGSGIRVAKSDRQGTMGYKSANLCSKISEKLVNLLLLL